MWVILYHHSSGYYDAFTGVLTNWAQKAIWLQEPL
jgi:hypothetical protein